MDVKGDVFLQLFNNSKWRNGSNNSLKKFYFLKTIFVNQFYRLINT